MPVVTFIKKHENHVWSIYWAYNGDLRAYKVIEFTSYIQAKRKLSVIRRWSDFSIMNYSANLTTLILSQPAR